MKYQSPTVDQPKKPDSKPIKPNPDAPPKPPGQSPPIEEPPPVSHWPEEPTRYV